MTPPCKCGGRLLSTRRFASVPSILTHHLGETMKLPHTIGKTRSLLAASALLFAGFGGGAVIAATGSADAATGSASSSTTSTHGHDGETALTGTTAAKVKAAALAKYPGATVQRVETDSDGVYEAHLTTK